MSKKSISIRIDEKLLKSIDSYAQSRRMSRTQAITSMLKNTKIILINEGPELIKSLYSLDTLLKRCDLERREREKIEGVCNEIWQLLNLITAKIQHQTEE